MVKLETLRAALAARPRETLHIEGFRRAAVLVPLLQTEAGLELLFTVRASGLSSHASQISFPGGRVDARESLDDAARRETLEEVGLNVPESALLGYLDEHPSPARYIVTPVVAALSWPQALVLNPAEVSSTFTVPLDVLLDVQPYNRGAPNDAVPPPPPLLPLRRTPDLGPDREHLEKRARAVSGYEPRVGVR